MLLENIVAKKNARGTKNLLEHSIEIANISFNLASDICEDEKIRWLCYISALLHDVGKSSNSFQEHIKEDKSMSEIFYPLHNILGACLISNFVETEDLYNINYINKVVAKTILYHHPIPFGFIEKQICAVEEIINDDIFKIVLNEFIKINNERFPQFRLKLVNKKEIYINSTLDNLQYYESNCDFATTKQDIFHIVSNIVRFADCLFTFNKSKDELINRHNHIDESQIIKPSSYDNRFDVQIKYAKELAHHSHSIFESQTGFGKTMLGLLYTLYTNNRKTYWICPRNTIAEGVYKTLINEIKNLNLSDKLSVGLLLTNEFVYGDKNSDIIVTNIDNFLRPIISTDGIDRTYHLLHSNCIFDEFHEYVMDSPIMALFEIMIRSRYKVNTNTLYLSATPIMNFFNFMEKGSYTYVTHVDEAIAQRKYTIDFYETFNDLPKDICGSLISTNSTKLAQDMVTYNVSDKTFHSRFLKSDKERLFNEIEFEFGKNSNLSKRLSKISATNIITTGVDVSFKNVIISSPLPDRMIQAIGRCNRWNESNKSKIVVIPLPHKHLSEKQSLEKQHLLSITNIFYKMLFDAFSNKTEIVFQELYELRKAFYTKFKNEYNSQFYLVNKKESFKSLVNINYQMALDRSLNDENEEIQFIGNNQLRNIKNRNFYCLLCDKNGKDIDEVFEGNDLIFNFKYNVYEAKNGKRIVATFEKENAKKFKNNENYFSGHKKKVEKQINNLIQRNRFIDFLLVKAKCKKTPIYIPCVWYYDNKLGVVKVTD